MTRVLRCCVCKKMLPETDFHVWRASPRGRDYRCIPCKKATRKWDQQKVNARVREWQSRNPYRKQEVLYGMRRGEMVERLEAQERLCAICRDPLIRRVSVDHDHVTGRVRDILCHYCNLVLGMAKDRREILLAAVDYLDRHLAARSEVA